MSIPVGNAEMPKDLSVCKTAPVCIHDQKEKPQNSNSVSQESSKKSDDTKSG